MDNEHAAAYGPSCADCGSGGCADGSGAYPPFCATAALAAEDRAALLEQYRDEEVYRIMAAASDTARLAFDEHWCRVEETMEYARRTGARKLGIAVCSGLLGEGRTLARILRANGFDVYGMACKVGSLTRAELGARERTHLAGHAVHVEAVGAQDARERAPLPQQAGAHGDAELPRAGAAGVLHGLLHAAPVLVEREARRVRGGGHDAVDLLVAVLLEQRGAILRGERRRRAEGRVRPRPVGAAARAAVGARGPVGRCMFVVHGRCPFPGLAPCAQFEGGRAA